MGQNRRDVLRKFSGTIAASAGIMGLSSQAAAFEQNTEQNGMEADNINTYSMDDIKSLDHMSVVENEEKVDSQWRRTTKTVTTQMAASGSPKLKHYFGFEQNGDDIRNPSQRVWLDAFIPTYSLSADRQAIRKYQSDPDDEFDTAQGLYNGDLKECYGICYSTMSFYSIFDGTSDGSVQYNTNADAPWR